jgi:ABC-type phosphate/phosphonate transport system ATPase subunit
VTVIVQKHVVFTVGTVTTTMISPTVTVDRVTKRFGGRAFRAHRRRVAMVYQQFNLVRRSSR